jgi:predicted aspartyl protease
MSINTPRYGKEEFASRGKALFTRHLASKSKIELSTGYAAIEIESGRIELDGDPIQAMDRILARIPGAQIWLKCLESHLVSGTSQAPANSEEMVPLIIRSPAGLSQGFKARVDANFAGWLCLPHSDIQALKLPWRCRAKSTLDTESILDIHEAFVIWNQRLRRVCVECRGEMPVIGTGLLGAA